MLLLEDPADDLDSVQRAAEEYEKSVQSKKELAEKLERELLIIEEMLTEIEETEESMSLLKERFMMCFKRLSVIHLKGPYVNEEDREKFRFGLTSPHIESFRPTSRRNKETGLETFKKWKEAGFISYTDDPADPKSIKAVEVEGLINVS